MLNNELKVYYLIKKLKYRYSSQICNYVSYYERVCDADYLTFIIYNSLPIVYLDVEENMPEFMRLASNRANQKTRCKKYLTKMFNTKKSNLYFVTLTFDDSAFELKPNVRRKYVLQWCAANCFDYFGNVDFGKTNSREHYHIVCDLKDYYDMWEYGFMYSKPINVSKVSITRINKYLHKLVNHSSKITSGKSFHKRKSKKSLVSINDFDLEKIF